MQLLERMKEDLLNHILNFAARHSRQQDSVYEWRVKMVKATIHVSIAFKHCPDKHSTFREFSWHRCA
jgi:hypothetical protein